MSTFKQLEELHCARAAIEKLIDAYGAATVENAVLYIKEERQKEMGAAYRAWLDSRNELMGESQ